jgi:hypothetical protein
MKAIKLPITINLLLILALGISGQTNPYPYEIKGYELYGKGKLVNINMLISNEKDALKIFGKNCESGCDYDEKWTISFRFLNKREYISEGSGEKRFYVPKKYIGKLSEIHFLPKKHISFEGIIFPNLFQKGVAYQTGDELHPEDAGSMFTYSADFGPSYLKYVVCSTTSVSGRYQKSDVFSIDYSIDREEIFGLGEYYTKKNKRLERKKTQ